MKPKTATLRVPAKFYDEALAFVNARRKEKKLRPIKALPAGKSQHSHSCPCAATCGAPIAVESRGFWWWRNGFVSLGNHRGGPTRFTNYFDDNAKVGALTLPLRGMKAGAK